MCGVLRSEAQEVELFGYLVNDYGEVGRNQVTESHECSVERFGI